MQVMGSGGCLTARNVIAYKLRARDSAVIDAYPTLSLHSSYNISPR